MKRWKLFSLWLALIGVQAHSQELKVWINDGVMTADGATKTTLTVFQTDPSDDQYVAFQMKMRVPKGIHIAKKKQGRVDVDDLTLNEIRFEGLGHSLSGNMPDENTIVLSCADMNNNPFYPDDAEGNVVEELFTIGLTADNTMTNGVYTITLSGVDFIHSDGSFHSPQKEISFKLTVTEGKEPVETPISYTLSEAGVGTLILPYDAMLPDGLKAYKCVSVKESTVLLEEQDNIAAFTPVLLQGKAGTYSFTGTPVGGNGYYRSGLLTGVIETETITNGYVLQKLNGVTAFYIVNPEKPITVPAYHCYLQHESNVRMLNIQLLDDATSVSNLQNGNEGQEMMYDINGRRTTIMKKGIYIMEKKKIISNK